MQIKWKPRGKISLVIAPALDPPAKPGTIAKLNYISVTDGAVCFYVRWRRGTTGMVFFNSNGVRPVDGGWRPERFTNPDGSRALPDAAIHALCDVSAFEVAMILTTVFGEGTLHE